MEEDFAEKHETTLLSNEEFGIYIRGFWLFAFKLRLETLPAELVLPSVVAIRCNASEDSAEKAIDKLLEVGYITRREDGSITVNGLARHSGKVKFKDVTKEDYSDLPLTVPTLIADLELYSQDKPLLAKWPSAYKAWKQTYPMIDVDHEIRASHAWLISKGRRNKRYAQFINYWLKNAYNFGKNSYKANEPARESTSERTAADWG
jgi:hypothetical protein